MPLPVDARVSAARSFVASLESIRELLQLQDHASAEKRFDALLDRIEEARLHVAWNPQAGRPARLLSQNSPQGRAIARRAAALASAQGTPYLRELVLKPYVLLYAHNSESAILLALKHERQLLFSFH